MNVIIDEGVGSVYVGLHDMPGDPDKGGINHSMEKHGILTHWDGHGKLCGIEFTATGEPIRIIETNNIEGHIEREY
jgi:hypothetical protein